MAQIGLLEEIGWRRFQRKLTAQIEPRKIQQPRRLVFKEPIRVSFFILKDSRKREGKERGVDRGERRKKIVAWGKPRRREERGKEERGRKGKRKERKGKKKRVAEREEEKSRTVEAVSGVEAERKQKGRKTTETSCEDRDRREQRFEKSHSSFNQAREPRGSRKETTRSRAEAESLASKVKSLCFRVLMVVGQG
ncbi:pre-mRNA-splicing factor 38B-like [Carica papaya]|uniref:pre-mRNA-splicing factor 38B-like n=1 Tax=Carica papaya TaxID=3649 RepID=UPI000B8D040A|nr:pre-mRNA-splicing factor 38B-like [Carica papaya]